MSTIGKRQPDYFLGSDGIPQPMLVSLAGRKYKSMDHRRPHISGTDPIKMNKCLYNHAVKSLNNVSVGRLGNPAFRSCSVNVGDSDNRMIRHQYGHKSIPSGSVNSSINQSGQVSSTVFGSWNNPSITSQSSDPRRVNPGERYRSNQSFIPRSRTISDHHTSGNNPFIRCNNVTGTNESSSAASVASKRLLMNRSQQQEQRRNSMNLNLSSDATNGSTTADVWNRHASPVYSNSNHRLVRPCSFTTTTGQKSSPPSKDNRLNYQRAYDRSIFGYNRLDQLVLPPLQI